MKTALFLSFLAMMSVATTSCRTTVPLDPNTMRPSCRCMPQYYQAPGPDDCGLLIVRRIGMK